MDVSYINPFIQAAQNVFRTVLDCDIERRQVMAKDDSAPTFDVSAVIGLSGKARGAVAFSVSDSVAFMVVKAMLEVEVDAIDSDVVDAIGELANMIAGGAKTALSNYEMSISLPNVVVGKGHCIDFPSRVRPICVLFETPAGPISLEVGLDTSEVELTASMTGDESLALA